MNGEQPSSREQDLDSLLVSMNLEPVGPEQAAKFHTYLGLILQWNARINLTAVREAEGIQRRHFVESIACARLLPAGIDTLLDFGSGAGFPGIPIALCRPEISVTLAESQAKKAAFLQEAVRVLRLTCKVWPNRTEDLNQRFDCVALRAVDHMERAVHSGAGLVKPGGWLGILTTSADQEQMRRSAGAGFDWREPSDLPGSEQRVLELGSRQRDS
jgi:16S rRNA (guanine527-N7)-methyltransferase